MMLIYIFHFFLIILLEKYLRSHFSKLLSIYLYLQVYSSGVVLISYNTLLYKVSVNLSHFLHSDVI